MVVIVPAFVRCRRQHKPHPDCTIVREGAGGSINLADLGYRTVVRYVARDSTNLAGLGYGTVVRYVAGSNKVTTRNRAGMLFVMLPEAA